MSVEILKKVRDFTGLRNYGIHKRLQEKGCKITLQGLDGYDRTEAKSIRVDVLTCLESLCCEDFDLPRTKFWDWVKADGMHVMK